MIRQVVTVDVIIAYPDGAVVLIRRGQAPFKGTWALPGGILGEGETVEECAVREAKEETGLTVRLRQIIGVFSEPGRDPRGRYISVAFLAEPVSGEPRAGSDAAEVIITKEFRSLSLAFDHARILDAAFPTGT